MKLTPRPYQSSIFESIMRNGNTLVVLPTGLGKTLVALMLIENRMKLGRCIMLTPTKPLAKQHQQSIIDTMELPEEEVSLVNGEITPNKRKKLYESKIIISTPQTINNDLENGILEPNASLVIFDECHRAIGDYAYTKIGEVFGKNSNTLMVGLTASPGGNRQKIKEVIESLKIKNVEIRTLDDPDVSPYVQKSDATWVTVELTDHFKKIKSELDHMTGSYAQKLSAMGFPPPLKHKGQFMQMRNRILNIQSNVKYPALINYSILLHLLHLTELLETQGIYPVREYIAKLKEKDSKSAIRLLSDPGLIKVEELAKSEEDHPKLKVLVEQIKQLDGKKAIVFVQYRSQITRIVALLTENSISAKQFVGKKDGVTRKVQEETIEEFRNGKFDILVASSIGEEGLDIPAVDAVIFYEPVPSEIRSIQRRGRAARMKEGKVIVLMTKGTRDEFHHYASKNREKKMKSIIGTMQGIKQPISIEKKTRKKKERPMPKPVEKKEQVIEIEGQMKITDF